MEWIEPIPWFAEYAPSIQYANSDKFWKGQ